ncbi:hypothetical protein T01_15879 [Trichinella spiralis]|uniref:Uncharacterized protein n=1 Tax=Trichinella spiralis TaxID=6334 RepID=A0A0V1BCM6_TRISP|nr:hypothetical protein T01_15879 [Trichinella spiralis]
MNFALLWRFLSDRSLQRSLIISKGAFVCLIYVAIGSIVERSLSSLRALMSNSNIHSNFIFPYFHFVKPLTHEKHCIQISKHVTNHGKIMHMDKKEDKWRKPRSV